MNATIRRAALPAVVLAVGLAAAAPRQARAVDDGWTIAGFDVKLTVRPDSGLDVAETIDADFDVPKHGVLREIPVRYDVGMHLYDLRFLLLGVDDGEGSPWPTSVDHEENRVKLRIGDPERTVVGRQRFRIRYRVQRAVIREASQAWSGEGRAVLRWNSTGTEWQVPIGRTRTTVRLPRELDESQVSFDAWVGRFGSTGGAFRKRRVDGRTIEFQTGLLQPREGITVEVAMPDDVVARPGAWRRLGWWLTDNFPYGLVPLSAGLCFLAWFHRGRDEEGMGTIVVGYEPPDGLSPAEVGTLIDERVDLRDVSASIIDLAVRGFLRIEAVEREGWFSTETDYRFEKLRDAQGLKPFEEILYNRIFRGGVRSVLLSALKEKFHPTLASVKSYLYKSLTREKYFDGDPDAVRYRFMFAGLALVAAASGLAALLQYAMIGRVFWVPMAVAATLSALSVAATSRYMPRKTRKGRIAWEKIAGLEEYIRRAEVDDIREQERRGVFERLLPYAIVFGMSDRWGEAFADLYRTPPDWYRPAGDGDFSTWRLICDMNRSMDSMNRTFPSQPRSEGRGSGYSWSSGGFGGGGSSGGGFGGGGGSSW